MSEIILNNYRVTLGQPEAGAFAAAAAADPAAPMVVAPSEGQELSDFAIIQLSQPLDKSGRLAIAETGVKLGERISETPMSAN